MTEVCLVNIASGIWIADILKHTCNSNQDYAALEQALSSIKGVMTHINEDKRKTEGQIVMFNIFNDIDNCPVSLLLSTYVTCTLVDAVKGSRNMWCFHWYKQNRNSFRNIFVT